MPAYQGPRDSNGSVTPPLLFRWKLLALAGVLRRLPHAPVVSNRTRYGWRRLRDRSEVLLQRKLDYPEPRHAVRRWPLTAALLRSRIDGERRTCQNRAQRQLRPRNPRRHSLPQRHRPIVAPRGGGCAKGPSGPRLLLQREVLRLHHQIRRYHRHDFELTRIGKLRVAFALNRRPSVEGHPA